jgi:autotransporter-associated beta strand protein
LVLGSANIYTGSTTISSGALRALNNNSLGSSASGTSIGNDPTARLELTGDITLAEPLTVSCKGAVNGNVPAVVNVSGTNTLAGPITHTTGGSYWTYQAAGGKLVVTGAVTNSTTTNVRTVWLRGAAVGEWRSAIGDSAAALGTAIRKDDMGTWILAGTNSYSGGTIVSNGTVLVNGVVVGGTVTVAGGILGGTGLIKAAVLVNPGAALAPGPTPATLTISNALTLTANSRVLAEINAQTLTNNLVRGISSVVYAGTLSVSNVAGTLAGGQSFKLFSATSFSGAFNSLSPASPGPNLSWNFNPTNGTLKIVSLPPPQITSFSLGAGDSFTLSGTGPGGQSYRVLATTNLALPFGSWTLVNTGTFTGGMFSFTDSSTTNYLQRYYRVATP